MRVIAGTAKSVPLKVPRGIEVRPTTDRIKETLFNIIQGEVAGSYFVDFFAGSGAIGIEALSRGARSALFIDKERDSIETIRYNLSKCRLLDRARTVRSDARDGVKLIPDTESLIIFMDPPYGLGLEYEVLRLLNLRALPPDTLIITEQTLNEDEGGFEETGYRVERVKKYKTQKHVFLKRSIS